MSSTAAMIRAAGVVLVRDGAASREALVIHRPHRSDWSLPKGKLDPGEHVIAAAVRECLEETGITPVLRANLPRQHYVAMSAPKTVDYWVAEVASGEATAPGIEVDDLLWLPVWQAIDVMTYPRDAELLEYAAALPRTVPLVLLRHAHAVKRADFRGGDDQQRPLDDRGKREARDLVPLMAAYGIARIVSSDSRRCQTTVRHYAEQEGLRLELEHRLSEEGYREDPDSASAAMGELMSDPRPLIVCSHRPVLPTLVDVLRGLPGADNWAEEIDHRLAPGSFIVLHRDPAAGFAVVAAERHQLGD